MAETRVWRLDVTYPEGSDALDWQPDEWVEREYREADGTPYIEPFRWPRVRLYLSQRGAQERAGLLRRYGASVVIVASDPVSWPKGTTE